MEIIKDQKLLRVNLTSRIWQVEKIPPELLEKYLGGSGLATKYLYDEVPPKTPAYAPQNKLIFAVGPYQGYPVPGGAKWSVVSRSPLTNTFGVSTAGAEWGVNLGKTGYFMVIIEGKAEKPVYILINNEEVEIKEEAGLWGKDALQATEIIKNKYLTIKNLSVATIGSAGEKQVGIACITTDNHSFAGRCGFGAVMGAKNLKAIAVTGNLKPTYAQKSEFQKLQKQLMAKLHENAKDTFRPHGTAVHLVGSEEIGDLPIKNWNQACWSEGAAKIGAPNFTKQVNAKPWPCQFCPVACHHKVDFSYNQEQIKGAGAEYETLGMLGSNCLIDDVKAISKANDLCNRLGIDTISAGSFVAFTMECFEKGLLSAEQLQGREAQWGNVEFMLELLQQIGNKEGFGAIFAEGIKPAAEKIGGSALELTVEVKNLDFPAHDPRSYFSLAINYATSTRGACHLRGYSHVGEGGAMLLPEWGYEQKPERFSMEKKAWITKLYQDVAAIHDSLVLCIFIPIHGMTLEETTAFLNFIAGTAYTSKDLLTIGERIVTLQREINVRDGISRKDDRLPPKMFVPASAGFRQGKVPEPFESTLLEYYQLRGWDNEGRPLKTKLKELGI